MMVGNGRKRQENNETDVEIFIVRGTDFLS